jgi:ubiquinone/menaquinone biosynthesis C-methylase UbiE
MRSNLARSTSCFESRRLHADSTSLAAERRSGERGLLIAPDVPGRTSRMPSNVDRREVWAELAAIYDATRTFPADGDRRTAEIAVRELRARGARRVLDLGCGTGRWSARLAAAGFAVVGADRSAEMLAGVRVKPGGAEVQLVRCDATRLPFARSFDAVVMSHFLHLQPALAPIAGALKRVLLPGATLLAIDAGFLAQPVAERVNELALRKLRGSFTPRPRGDRSRERLLLEELASSVGAGSIEAVPIAELPLAHSARDHLNAVRGRIWSAYRVFGAEEAGAAADEAERTLLGEGVDLDERREEPLGVRLLLARLAG